MGKFYNINDYGGQRQTNAGDGTAATDLVTLQQLQAKIDGNNWKLPVDFATTTNGTLATAYANGQVVDGVTLTTGMRGLVKDQTTGSENGIYTVNASGAPTRATDCDSATEFQDATCIVLAGTVNGPDATTHVPKAFTQTVKPVVVGTTSTIWVQSNSGNVYTVAASGGLSMTANALSVKLPGSSGLVEDSTGLYVTKASLAALGITAKYAQDSPSLSANTPATITHNLGTLDLDVSIYIKATGEMLPPSALGEIVGAGTNNVNTITIQSGTAQSAATFRIEISG